MALANIGYYFSCAEPSPSKGNSGPKLRHGGPRNFADRVTVELTSKQARKLREAWAFADWQGRTLNYWITIQWSRLGIDDAKAGAALSAFLTYVRDFLRKQGIPVHWVYVRENGANKGSHAHILLYLPSAAAKGFHALQEGWLERIARRPYVTGTIKGEALPRRAKWSDTPKEGEYATKQEAVQADSWYCLNYVMKGVPEPLAKELNLKKVEAGGAIIGKRVGVCDGLQPKAMTLAGYAPPDIHPMQSMPHKRRYGDNTPR